MTAHAEDAVLDHGVSEWEEALRAYSAVLDEQRSILTALDAGFVADHAGVPPQGFVPRPMMPPLPPPFSSRAQQLLDETNDLIDFANELARRSEARRPVRVRHDPGRSPSVLDALM